MSDTSQIFGHLYHPVKAMVIYRRQGGESDHYIEAFDMDGNGMAINGHPLSARESGHLAKALTVADKRSQGFLIPAGLLPRNVLYLNNTRDGFAIWHTPARQCKLLFAPQLGIPAGTAAIPALLWKAGRSTLQVFALQEGEIGLHSPLCKAPFFNIYADGKVCMGNVPVRIPTNCPLEKFIALWEEYFFHSYFSHTIHGESPVKGNIVQLWKTLIDTGEPFPEDQLKRTQYTLQNLLP